MVACGHLHQQSEPRCRLIFLSNYSTATSDVILNRKFMANMADLANSTSVRFRDFQAKNPTLPVDQAISHHDLMRLDHSSCNNQISESISANGNVDLPMLNMRCCCGRADCAYLEHNNTALGGLEKDLETAARLGQVRAFMSLHLVTSWIFFCNVATDRVF